MNPAFLSPLWFELVDVLDLRFGEGWNELCRRLQNRNALDGRIEVLFDVSPSEEGVQRPQVDVDAGRFYLPGVHLRHDAGLDRSPDFVRASDRGQVRLEGVPCLPIGAQSFRGAVLQEAAFLEECFVDGFQHGKFRYQRLYEPQLEFLSD